MRNRRKAYAASSARKRGLSSLLRALVAVLMSFSLVQNAFADILNTAIASGTYQALQIDSTSAFVSIPVTLSTPAIELLKSSVFNDESADGFAQAGETISYSFSVENTGNVTLSNISVADNTATMSGGPIASLNPGAVDTTTFTAIYTLLPADVAAGFVNNSATATGTTPFAGTVNDVSDSQNPGDDTGADNDPTTTTLITDPIDAVLDDFTPTPINGLTGGSTATVYTNDTLNNVAFAPALVTPSIFNAGGLTGVGINGNGQLTVPAGTTPGTYNVTYQICETADLANCDTAVATVLVNPPVIDAVADNFTPSPVNGLTGGNTPAVYTNDTLNAVGFLPAAVTPSIFNAGGLTGVTINPSGTLTVPAGTTAGTYNVTYQICETANPINCDTAVAIVVVTAATIAANDDNFTPTPINGLTGGNTTTVYVNDTLNGVAFAPAVVTPTIIANGGLTGVTINASGTLSVPANSTPGSYVVNYRICEVANPTNCDTANATVLVNPPAIDAVVDNFSASPINGLTGGNTATVFSNDTLNGVAFAPAAVIPSIVATGGLTGATIDAAGALTVPAGTAAGTYVVIYRICEVANPTNCDNANATVVVNAATIIANDDDFTATPFNGMVGGSTTTVYVNDTLNGVAFAPAAVLPTIIANGGLTGVGITGTGTLTVPAGTAAGTYIVTYRICEVANSSNCDTANATILVNPPVIDAVADNFSATPINGLTGGSTATVYTNDTLNGAAFLPAAVLPSIFNNGGLAGVGINSNGQVTVPAGTLPSTYNVTYRICEVVNPANCDTAVATVVVNPPVIDAVADNFTPAPINGLVGGSTATVYGNDTLNGAAFLTTAVIPSIVATGGLTGVGINSSGQLTVPAGTTAGTYNVTYRICEVANPANCDTAIATVLVNPPVIDAVLNNFSAAPVNGVTGGTTATVFVNDTLDGVAFPPAAIAPSIVTDGGLTGVAINPSGTLTVPAGTGAGTYVVNYRICEVANPANCDTANATVVVTDDATISGTVFSDVNGNGIFDGDPPAGAGYIVQLVNNVGTVVASATTIANGTYSITAPPGLGYRLIFREPDGSVIGGVPNLMLTPGQVVIDQNQPIDPSGIVYNSLTRLPVAGVTVTITDSSNTPLPGVCLIDASQQNQMTAADGAYRFDLVPGVDPACPVGETEYRLSYGNPVGYVPTVSTVMPPQAGALEVTACAIDPAPGGACQVSPSANPPAAPNPGVYYTAFLLQANDPHVVNNHIPIDPIISTTSAFTKKALVKEARRGERVPYVIEADAVSFNPARIVDIIPPGFDYAAGSARVNGTAQEPVISGRNLTFGGIAPDGFGKIKIELTLIATVAVTTGPHVNTAQLYNDVTGLLVASARASVTIVAEHVFDCNDIIGKVFDDKNRDGYQDKGEPGLAGVRLVTAKGVQITTDKNGLFHVACADIPDADIGSNFILKLDTRTLPTGYRMTTENPRVVRLTGGKMTKLNFGASITRLVRFDMTTEAFLKDSTEMKPQWLAAIDKLMAVLQQDKSTLRLTYFAKTSGSKLAAARAAAVEKMITEKWGEQSGSYTLSIETRVIGSK
jgi:hypothetical protein